ncbi:hypothetical protein GGX14DRAFT_601214 [Mycena pura]|uniref:Uncharacterized protein n=1 Tax=Mycena pura TaxID=153505 RepID=A0AAD6UMZ0_9AGAR|nr:hypothetical protein GGX14DRAFT_601214 [Mycena pura]
MPTFNSLYESNDDVEPLALPPLDGIIGLDDPAIILHSSGSTAFPKLITSTYRILMESGLIPYHGQVDVCGDVLTVRETLARLPVTERVRGLIFDTLCRRRPATPLRTRAGFFSTPPPPCRGDAPRRCLPPHRRLAPPAHAPLSVRRLVFDARRCNAHPAPPPPYTAALRRPLLQRPAPTHCTAAAPKRPARAHFRRHHRPATPHAAAPHTLR